MIRRVLGNIRGGYQYCVYFKNSEVVKVPKSDFEIALAILYDRPGLLFNPSELLGEVVRVETARKDSVEKFNEGCLLEESIVDTKIKDNGVIIQERVSTVQQEMKEACLDRQRELVDEYIDLIFRTWKHGFSVASFNFTINYGIDSNGKLVILDFGELIWNKAEVENQIESKSWLDQDVFKKYLPQSLKPYFKERMNEEVNKENLEKHWSKNT